MHFFCLFIFIYIFSLHLVWAGCWSSFSGSVVVCVLPDAAPRWSCVSPDRWPLTPSEGWVVSGVWPAGCVLSPRACEGQTGAGSRSPGCHRPWSTRPAPPAPSRAPGDMPTAARTRRANTADRHRCTHRSQPADLQHWTGFSGFSPDLPTGRRRWTRRWRTWLNSSAVAGEGDAHLSERERRRGKNGKTGDSF